MSLLIALAFSQIEINYACKDQHIDATFKSYQEAKNYADMDMFLDKLVVKNGYTN